MRPLIGITVCIDRAKRLHAERDYLYVARSYSQAVARAGGVPVLLTPDTPEDSLSALDGFVLSGGDDLPTHFADAVTKYQPERIAGLPAPSQQTPGNAEEEERIGWERELIRACQRHGQPMLGICFGMQLLNLHLGGTLMEDLQRQRPESEDHGGSGRLTRHAVTRTPEAQWLSSLPEAFETNSSHGQAIATLAPSLTATAHSKDGVIEAFEGEGLCGVEWHPELDETCEAVFSQLIRRCAC